MAPYLTYKEYLVAQYGEPLYRIPVDLGFGCPNRDEEGMGGCTFCPTNGARAQQTLFAESVEDQVREAIDFAVRRYRASKFMAYVQAYTGTFASASKQRELFSSILARHKFQAISVGTRPDCLSRATVAYLAELNQQLDVWVELGVQTTHDTSLLRINRGHDWECSKQAIVSLEREGIKVIAHVILGLPGESFSDIMLTAERLANLPLSGIKLHNLHVIRNTELAVEYERMPFPLMNEHEYCELVIEFLRRLPPNLPVVRLQTDTPEAELVAPKWTLGKADFIAMVNEMMIRRQMKQGDLWNLAPNEEGNLVSQTEARKPRIARVDSSKNEEGVAGFINSLTSSHNRFIVPSELEVLLKAQPVRLLDLGFGSGANTLAAMAVARRTGSNLLEIHGLEFATSKLEESVQCCKPDALEKEVLANLLQNREHTSSFCKVAIHWGDARHTIGILAKAGAFDIVFLDADSVQQNCELWTVDFFKQIFSLLGQVGRVVSPNTSLPVLSGLMEAGFQVGLCAVADEFRKVTLATKGSSTTLPPLSDRAWNKIRSTTVGIPYRDPQGVNTRKEILRMRAREVAAFDKIR